MPTWLSEIWKDFWERTALYPLESGLLVGLVLLCVLIPFRAPAAWVRRLRRLANRRHLAVASVFAVTIVGHWLLQPSYTAPAPGLHDEYSYLLASDTFAQGRLTNPAHPMGYFFESFHINVDPTYMSMYPPAQGFALALGQAVFGHPMAGVWLSVAAACAALCWMLQAWMPPRWALLGGALAAIRIGWFSYWANSYWGGAAAMIGGALVLGGLPRLVRRPTASPAVAAAIGVWILLNSRPFEGILLLAPCAVWLLWKAIRIPPPSRPAFWRACGAGAAVLALGVAWMIYYNYKLTGSPFQMAYSVNRNRYAVYKWFIGSPPDSSITYNHPVMEKFYKDSENQFRSLPFVALQASRIANLWWFFIGPALTLALAGLWKSRRSRSVQAGLALTAILLIGNLLVVWPILPHYAGPFAGAFYLLLISGMRGLRLSEKWGRGLVRAVVACCLLMAVVRATAPAMGFRVYGEEAISWYTYGHLSNTARAKMEARLSELGGQHLILVEYTAAHSPHMEWVYNHADIDAATVVWARMVPDPAKMARLLQYYRSRKIWVVRPDVSATQIFQYRE